MCSRLPGPGNPDANLVQETAATTGGEWGRGRWESLGWYTAPYGEGIAHNDTPMQGVQQP